MSHYSHARYGEGRRIDPASLTAAIGINAALIGAIMFAAPKVIPAIDPIFEGTNIPLPEQRLPDPEPTTRPETKSERTTETRTPPAPDRPVATEPVAPTAGPGPDIITGGTSGGGIDGTGTLPLDPPRPAPVFVDASLDPRHAAAFRPDYPPAERRAGTEGKVVVRVLIGTDGRVKAIERVSSVSEGLWEATRRHAFAKWRFRPATRDGVAVESWKRMTMTFRLEDEE